MIAFLAVITLFPLIVAMVLKSRYMTAVVSLEIVGIAAFAFEYLHFMLPEKRCTRTTQYLMGNAHCGISNTTVYFLLIYFIITLSAIMWFMAFKQKDTVSGIAANRLTKPALTIAGWLIIVTIVLIIGGFILAFSQI